MTGREVLEQVREAQALVREQAEDEALWAVAPLGEQPVAEAYLQQELRRLHEAVERIVVDEDDLHVPATAWYKRAPEPDDSHDDSQDVGPPAGYA